MFLMVLLTWQNLLIHHRGNCFESLISGYEPGLGLIHNSGVIMAEVGAL